MSKKKKALAAIFSLVPSVSVSQELHTRWWIPITERQAPNGLLIFILSQNNECSHLLRTHFCVVLDSFARVASFFSLFSYISRGGTQQSLGGGFPRSLTPYPFIYHFWRDNYIKHKTQCFITRWRQKRREERRRVENTTRSGVFHFIEKHYPFHIPKMTDFPTLSYTSTGEIPFLSYT